MASVEAAEIQALLPHRYPFLLVDRVKEFEPHKRIVGFKNVTVNEPFFQGHFPGRPVMPGVLIIEAMAQMGGVLVFKSGGPVGKTVMYLTGIDEAKFQECAEEAKKTCPISKLLNTNITIEASLAQPVNA